MVGEIMNYCDNFFPVPFAGVAGNWEILGGNVEFPNLKPGQYFLIEGSAFNDGVHRYGDDNLDDEVFRGVITPLAPPPAFLKLCEEVAEWCEKYAAVSVGPYQSESFAGYTYQMATNKNGNPITWRDVFANRLNVWRKL